MSFKRLMGISDVKSRYLKDPLAFLKQIIKARVVRFPFQNITSFGQYRPVDRHSPGLKEMFEANFSGGGGLCGHHNVFLKYQLECLGYEVTQLLGEFVRTGIPNSHILCMVRIPERLCKDKKDRKSKRYLVDVGCGIPLHDPICLEDLPFWGRGGGFDFKYEWIDSNTIQRVNIGGDALIGSKPANFISPQNYTISLRPTIFQETKGPVAKVYSNPHSVFLHQGIYCFRYLSIEEHDFHAVCIRGKELIHITKEARSVESFKEYRDLEQHLYKFFPMICPSEIQLTIRHFSMPFKEALQLPPIRQPQLL